jgi:hypothetical protein
VKLWHNTIDALRLPDKIRSGLTVELWIGTYPIEPGQHVKVEWRATQHDGTSKSGNVPAFWQYNDFAVGNGYWLAKVGPFQQGDKVEYSIIGTSGGSAPAPEAFEFTVDRG